MEFIFELLMGFFEELFSECFLKNPKVKVWVKTVVMSILMLFLLAVFALLIVLGWTQQLWLVFALGCGLFLVFGYAFVVTLVKQHKLGWKQDID